MKFGIVVNEGPYQHQASDSAYLFCKAAIEKGHEVWRVFFYSRWCEQRIEVDRAAARMTGIS